THGRRLSAGRAYLRFHLAVQPVRITLVRRSPSAADGMAVVGPRSWNPWPPLHAVAANRDDVGGAIADRRRRASPRSLPCVACRRRGILAAHHRNRRRDLEGRANGVLAATRVRLRLSRNRRPRPIARRLASRRAGPALLRDGDPCKRTRSGAADCCLLGNCAPPPIVAAPSARA